VDLAVALRRFTRQPLDGHAAIPQSESQLVKLLKSLYGLSLSSTVNKGTAARQHKLLTQTVRFNGSGPPSTCAQVRRAWTSLMIGSSSLTVMSKHSCPDLLTTLIC